MYYDLDASGYITGDLKYGEQGFYRISRDGASSIGNQGYLPLLTEKVPNDWTKAASIRFGLVYGDAIDDQESTQIDGVQSNMSQAENTYYNMRGQKLNGKPSRHGLYIVNGKKMYIK